MDFTPQLLGGLCLAVIVSIVWYQRRLKPFNSAEPPVFPPPRIDLTRVPNPIWRDAAKIEKLLDPLLCVGFVTAGWFEIPELPEMRVEGLVDHKRNIYAAVCESAGNVAWVEIFSCHQNGTIFLCSSHPAMDMPSGPLSRAVSLPGADSGDLFKTFLAERPNDAVCAATEDGFELAYEDAYRRGSLRVSKGSRRSWA